MKGQPRSGLAFLFVAADDRVRRLGEALATVALEPSAPVYSQIGYGAGQFSAGVSR
jgi:hypothetical protein